MSHFGETVEAVVRAPIAFVTPAGCQSWDISLQTKDKDFCKGPFLSSPRPVGISPHLPLHDLPPHSLPILSSPVSGFQSEAKGCLKMAVACQEASQLCGSCHLRERCLSEQLIPGSERGEGKKAGDSQGLH